MNKNVEVKYYTVTGEVGEFEQSVSDLMEYILPDMKPPVETISIISTFEGIDVTVDISKHGVFVRRIKV